jgi:hypothetical protein
MPSIGDFAESQNRRNKQALDRQQGTFKVADTDPFEVYLDGDETENVPALKIAGLSYSVGTTGIYLLRQGQLPVCWPTTT